MKIGKLIRIWRTIEGCSLRDLAKDIKISASTLSRVENGQEVDSETLIKLINFFCTPELQK